MFIYYNQRNLQHNMYTTVQILLRNISALMCHLQGIHVPSLKLVAVDKTQNCVLYCTCT